MTNAFRAGAIGLLVLVSASFPAARQKPRLRVAVHEVGRNAVASAFAAALRDAVSASTSLALSPDPTRVDIDVTLVSTPIACNERAEAAIAVGAHRLGRARSAQWVNVLVLDQVHAREYAARVVADVSAALAAAAAR